MQYVQNHFAKRFPGSLHIFADDTLFLRILYCAQGSFRGCANIQAELPSRSALQILTVFGRFAHVSLQHDDIVTIGLFDFSCGSLTLQNMEAAAFAVGIIALIGSFKDCIDLFSYLTVARTLGRDYELLSTKLDIERALLLQWAQRTNLLQPNYDRRLDDSTIRATVAKNVSSIRVLLSDTKSLQQRYGMRELQPGEEAYSNIFGMGANRMSTFAKDFGKLDLLLKDFEKLDLRIRGHRVASCTLKARWAVRDKDKFGILLQELSYFVSRLHGLVPDTKNTIQAMTEQDVQRLSNTKTVRLLSEAALGRDDLLAAIAEKHHIQTCERRILRCIWYRLMDDRRDALSPPNPQTFEWALDQSTSAFKWDSIAHWLRDDSSIYWICGKGT